MKAAVSTLGLKIPKGGRARYHDILAGECGAHRELMHRWIAIITHRENSRRFDYNVPQKTVQPTQAQATRLASAIQHKCGIIYLWSRLVSGSILTLIARAIQHASGGQGTVASRSRPGSDRFKPSIRLLMRPNEESGAKLD